MSIVFVAPFPKETTLRFVRAVKGLGRGPLLGVVHTLPGGPDAGLFDDVARVDNPLSLDELSAAVGRLKQRHGAPSRILGILEPIQVQLAALRERFGVEGPSVTTAERFRDKAQMKDALRAAGLPTARHRLIREPSDGRRFLEEVGLPMVLKPPAGMACEATWRIESEAQLERAIAAVRPSAAHPLLAEEMVRGSEHSLEALVVGGAVRMATSTQYHPTPLAVMENPWIQWCVLAPREQDGPGVREAAALAERAVEALGLRSGLTHMEWFRRPDGTLAIGEIAARPPGAQIVRLTGLAHDTSLYRAWARAVVDDAFDGPFERTAATGCAFLRGMGRGRVLGVEGADAVQRAVGSVIVEAELPKIGAPKSASYEGDGYAIVKHRDTEVVREALRTIVSNVRVRYG